MEGDTYTASTAAPRNTDHVWELRDDDDDDEYHPPTDSDDEDDKDLDEELDCMIHSLDNDDEDDDGCVCIRFTGDNPKCRVHTYFPNASSRTHNAPSIGAVSSSGRRINRYGEDEAPVRKKKSTNKACAGDATMMLASTASSIGAVSSSGRNRYEDEAPVRKKSKNARAVDAMMLASTNTVSSLSSSSGTTSHSSEQGSEELHLLSVHNTALSWNFFSIYDTHFHPDKENCAHCNLCGQSIAKKLSSTSGLRKHLRAKHRKEWEEANHKKRVNGAGTSSTPSVKVFFKEKVKEKTPEELKGELLNRATNFVIENCMPFTIVECTSFRQMFYPFHADAKTITAISADRVREAIFERGALAKQATMMEVAFFVGSWTCDHWTGKDGATYTTTTFHYIKNWVLHTIIVDFKVFHGTTSGEAIYKDQTSVLEQYTTKENIVLGVTDTTASMGVLGKFLRSKGMQHAYCTDHNLQCNAILAFDGK